MEIESLKLGNRDLKIKNYSGLQPVNKRIYEAVRVIRKCITCHSEFISESHIFNMLYLLEILKQVQDDITRTASYHHID